MLNGGRPSRVSDCKRDYQFRKERGKQWAISSQVVSVLHLFPCFTARSDCKAQYAARRTVLCRNELVVCAHRQSSQANAPFATMRMRQIRKTAKLRVCLARSACRCAVPCQLHAELNRAPSKLRPFCCVSCCLATTLPGKQSLLIVKQQHKLGQSGQLCAGQSLLLFIKLLLPMQVQSRSCMHQQLLEVGLQSNRDNCVASIHCVFTLLPMQCQP